MSECRIIARLDVKGSALIKSIHLEGLRVVGAPRDRAVEYYRQGVDELLYVDCVASLYGRNALADLIASTVREVFVPITVAGGIRCVDDGVRLLAAGADRIAVNTAAVAAPELIDQLARRLGRQAVVLSIEARRVSPGRWEACTHNGREPSGREVVKWAREGVDRGAGEVLLTSIDQEGTRRGFDVELLRAVSAAVSVPIVASGGLGSPRDLVTAVLEGGVSGVACADAFHYDRLSVSALRHAARAAGITVREAATDHG